MSSNLKKEYQNIGSLQSHYLQIPVDTYRATLPPNVLSYVHMIMRMRPSLTNLHMVSVD
jgi:hypothetical protein